MGLIMPDSYEGNWLIDDESDAEKRARRRHEELLRELRRHRQLAREFHDTENPTNSRTLSVETQKDEKRSGLIAIAIVVLLGAMFGVLVGVWIVAEGWF